jgi:hypothetical protein
MSALIFAWMRVDSADRGAFLDFHTREHLPERLAIPGFQRGRRFESAAAPNTFLVLYEVESLSVLTSAAYLERLNNPTDWTKRTMPLIRDNRRLAVDLDINLGVASNVLFVAHIEAPAPTMASAILAEAPTMLARDGVTAVRVGHVDEAASNAPTAERKVLGEHAHAHGLFFSAEAHDEASGRAALASTSLSAYQLDAYALQVTCGPTR